MSSKTVKVKAKAHPVVVMEAEVARKIRQHSRTSMKAEVCGVLIGTADEERTLIEACIAGVNAAQGGAHVTFTQDTWEHIYKIKDEQFPEKKIVGWYHSHPGFGVFLSEHDLFIQENFFSSPQQIAWVYDPHTDEEGCFGWVSGKTEKLNGVRFGYSQAVDTTDTATAGYEQDHEPFDSAVTVRDSGDQKGGEPQWVKWANRVLLTLAILGLGFMAGREFTIYQVAPQLALFDRMSTQPLQTCEEILQRIMATSGAALPPQTQDPAASAQAQGQTAPAKQQSQPAKKGPNGKQ